MRRLPRAWLGALVLVVALLSLGSVYDFFVGVPQAKIRASQMLSILIPGFFPSLPFVAASALILNAVVRFWFWRLSARGPGSSLLLWSAAIGLLAILVPFAPVVVSVLIQGVGHPDPRLALAAAFNISRAQAIIPNNMLSAALRDLEFTASLLFALGLTRSRLLYRWVPVLGIAALIVFSPSLLATAGAVAPSVSVGIPVWDAFVALGATGSILQVLFFVVVGISLLRGPSSDAAAVPK